MGIIHRDIKPANMMLTETGTLKVMDFGIARVLGTARMTKQGNIVGTIEYMSPEQVRGLETDARSDIYSLGILLYEMLTGRVPFKSDSEYDLMKMQIEDAPAPPRVFAAGIPPAVEQAIMRSLAKRQEARFQTAGEFRDVLLAAIGGTAPALTAPVISTPTLAAGSAFAAPQATASTPKETRLAAGAAGQFVPPSMPYQANVPVNYSAYQQPAPAAQPSKSNAKVFIALAAFVVIGIIGVAVALLIAMKSQSAAPAGPTTKPTQSTTPSPAPSSSQPSIPAQPPPQSIPQPEVARPVERPPASAPLVVEGSNNTKPAKSARKDNDADAEARKEKARKAAEARKLLSQ